jgi:hypothetical protein
MKKTLLFTFLLLCGCSSIGVLYNDFGTLKEQQAYTAANEPIRIYIDRHGDLYPDFRIKPELFLSEGSILDDVYTKDHTTLLNVFKGENIRYDTGKTIDENKAVLQLHMDQKYIDLIDKASGTKTIVYLIHGYNNNAERASITFSRLRVALTQMKPEMNFQFVEVYWDGLNNGDKIFNTVKIWDNAQFSAARAGLGLRRILNKTKADHSYVITHSLGAAVITEALFNASRFKDSFYVEDSLGIEIKQLHNNVLYNSPSSRFTVGMLTPAIPGKNVFQDYYQRTVKGKDIKEMTTPYEFINGFNEYDIATTKWKFSKYVGATTLSCNEEEHEKVRNFFSGNTSIYDRVVFSRSYDKKQTSHAVKDYIENENFPAFISKVFAIKQ